MRSNAARAFPEFAKESAIEIRDRDGYKGIFAKELITADSVIFHLQGSITTRPTRFTIQLGSQRHLTFPTIRKANDNLDYCWQYLNHSCEANG